MTQPTCTEGLHKRVRPCVTRVNLNRATGQTSLTCINSSLWLVRLQRRLHLLGPCRWTMLTSFGDVQVDPLLELFTLLSHEKGNVVINRGKLPSPGGMHVPRLPIATRKLSVFLDWHDKRRISCSCSHP